MCQPRSDCDAGVMMFGNFGHDSEPQAAAIALIRVQPVKTLKNQGGLIGRNADATVCHFQHQRFARLR